jgi:hypothetical protein
MEVYDPALDSWDITKAPMHTSRVEFGACAVNGKIYVIGGAPNHGGSPLGTVEEYDPLTDTWDTTKTSMQTPRYGCAYGVIDNKIYVAGGTVDDIFTTSVKLEIYDPATDNWDTKEDMLQAIYQPQGAVINDTFYVIGGLIGAPWYGQTTVQVYDPATYEWSSGPELPQGRVGHIANSVEDSIYVIGGDTQPPILNSVIEYYSGSNGWDEINLQPRNMILHTAIVFEQDIYVFSGSTSSVPSLSPSSTCYYFDTVVGVETQDNDVPENFMLYQNYPNPFNPSTQIKYSVPQSSNVVIKVFDILGNEVETLVDEKMSAGTYQFTWNAKHLPSGLYLYSLQAGDPSTGLPAGRQGSGQGFIETKKMILLK